MSRALSEHPAIIPGLAENLRVVPDDPDQWKLWSQAVYAYRIKKRREFDRDLRVQRVEKEKCRRDPCYFAVMYGVIFEPRSIEEDRPPQWSPFVLFAYQVRMIRWIEDVMQQRRKGRGDGLVEKSRDMGATWIFCLFAVHHFLFEEVFVCGFISKRFEDVDNINSSDTLFYKLRALLGQEDAVPPFLKIPIGLLPPGFGDKNVTRGAIGNPEPGKTCFLVGETTTALAGVGGRSTMRVNDEAARFDAFGNAWANQQATTDHRFALSSADLRFGRSFYDLAMDAQKADMEPGRAGPSYLRLGWWLHPFHDNDWFEDQKDRGLSDPAKFAREYEMDYFAGQGGTVYPRFANTDVGNFPYDPNGGAIYCFIDNGIRDPAAIIYVQRDYGRDTYNVIYAFQGKGGEDVRFYASILAGTYVSGENMYDYNDPEYESQGIHELMAFTNSLSREVKYYGDPAGNNRTGAIGEENWYTMLAKAVREINPSKSVYVNTMTGSDINGKNIISHEYRKEKVNKLLPRFRFNNNAGGKWVLFCLTRSKYRVPTRGRELIEPNRPEHDELSHTRTAFEFGCVNLDRMEGAPINTQKKSPVRLGMNGKPIHRSA